MNEYLHKQLKSHPEIANPVISEHLNNRSASEHEIAVYEWRASGPTEHLEQADKQNANNMCLTPVTDVATVITCCICLSVAKNPFRCTKPGEVNASERYNDKSTQVFHTCCYQCIANLMLTQDSIKVLCPTCRTNEFTLDKLFPVSNDIIELSKKYVIFCENNCGLMGDPISMYHHICPLSDSKQIGHSIKSNIVHELREENNKMTKELTDVLKNYEKKKGKAILWKSKYRALKTINDHHINEISRLSAKLEEIESINVHLKDLIKEKNLEICKLSKENRDTIKRCKQKLKCMKKICETRVQEVRDQRELFIEGVKRIASNSEAFELICAQATGERDVLAEVRGKADNSRTLNLSTTSEAVVYFKNIPYKLPAYDRESLSIIDLKKMIKKLIPDLNENEYELCHFTYKLIRENEYSNRYRYSVDNPKPLKTAVSRDNPNFIYLPKEMIFRDDKSIPFRISRPFVTGKQINSSISAIGQSDSEEFCDISVAKD